MTDFKVDQIWYKNTKGQARVKKIIAVEEKHIQFELLYPFSKEKISRVRKGTFRKDCVVIEPLEDYSVLDGAKLYQTYIVNGVLGEPIFRCSQRRASFYLRKGYAKDLGNNIIQLTDDQTEKKMDFLYEGKQRFNEFFMAVKNDKCVCCGCATKLTRHHVIPKRHKKKIPLSFRQCISNVLFLCISCHERYEKIVEPEISTDEWKDYIYAWKNHFILMMKPEHMPVGWDIITRDKVH